MNAPRVASLLLFMATAAACGPKTPQPPKGPPPEYEDPPAPTPAAVPAARAATDAG